MESLRKGLVGQIWTGTGSRDDQREPDEVKRVLRVVKDFMSGPNGT